MRHTIKLLIAWIVAVAVTTYPLGLGLAQELEPHLRGPQGPYRGRVVDVLTSQPVEGALVLIFWESKVQIPVPLHRYVYEERRVFALREILTNASGEFFLDATEIETALPPQSFPSRLVIYKPGYTVFPKETLTPTGEPAARFRGSGDTVWLRPLTKFEDRGEALFTFNAHLNRIKFASAEVKIPEVLRMIREEAEHLGLIPLPGTKKGETQ